MESLLSISFSGSRCAQLLDSRTWLTGPAINLTSGKALGNDNIPIEIIKCRGEYGTELFHKVSNNIWKACSWPQE